MGQYRLTQRGRKRIIKEWGGVKTRRERRGKWNRVGGEKGTEMFKMFWMILAQSLQSTFTQLSFQVFLQPLSIVK